MSETTICGVNTLRDATKEIFSTMIFMNVDPMAQVEENLSEESCIIGTIAFMGKYDGFLTIRCSQACAKAITMNLLALDDESEMEPSDIPDAIGEVANMVMGSVKSKLYDVVGELSVATPSVFSGRMMTPELRAGDVKLSTTVGIDEMYCFEVHFIYLDREKD